MLKPADNRTLRRLDFSEGVVGKYYEAAIAGRAVVVIDVDLVDSFPTPEAVNAALRSLRDIAVRAGKPLRTADRAKATKAA